MLSVVFYPTFSYLSILNKKLWYTILGDDMKPLKEKISITIDEDLLQKLRQLADEDDRSLSQYINLALKRYVESNKNKELWNP